MRLLLPVFVALLGAGACLGDSSGPEQGLTDVRTLDIEGEQRSFLVHVPAGVEPRAILFAFHGAGGTGAGLHQGTDLPRVARILKAVIAYPEADHFNWAEDCECTNADIVHGVADTAFVSAMGSALAREFSLPDDRHLAVGFSQGGMFAQRLACQLSDRFRAVAVVAATMSVPLDSACEPTDAVGVITILSTADPVFAWSGADQGALSTLGAVALSNRWADRNVCDGAVSDTETVGVLRRLYRGCPDGGGVELLGVSGGAHSWALSDRVDTGLEVARFLGS